MRPSAPLLTEGEERVDVAVSAPSGRTRLALGIRGVGTVARIAVSATAHAVGIIAGRCRSGSHQVQSTGRRHGHQGQYRVAHDLVSFASVVIDNENGTMKTEECV